MDLEYLKEIIDKEIEEPSSEITRQIAISNKIALEKLIYSTFK